MFCESDDLLLDIDTFDTVNVSSILRHLCVLMVLNCIQYIGWCWHNQSSSQDFGETQFCSSTSPVKNFFPILTQLKYVETRPFSTSLPFENLRVSRLLCKLQESGIQRTFSGSIYCNESEHGFYLTGEFIAEHK